MDRTANLLKHPAAFFGAGLILLALGYLYVYSFSLGYRMVTIVHFGVIFFLACAIFIRHLQSFFVFSMIFCISLQFGYHLVHKPLADMESQPFMSGIALDSVDVILALLYIYWGFRIATRLVKTKISLGHPLGSILLIWIGYCFLGGLLKSRSLDFSIYEIVVLLKGFLVYFYLINNMTTKRDLQIIVYALFATTMAHAVYVILQYVTGLNYTLHGDFQTYVGPEGYRSVGFFGSPDAAATLMSIVVPIGLAYYFFVEETSKRWLAAACIGTVFVAILCTKVRASGLAVVISSLSVIIISWLKGRISTSQAWKPIAAGLVLFLLAAPFIIHRFEIGTYGEARLPLISTAWEMFKDNWLFGVGVNNYFFYILDYVPPRLRQTWFYIVHNEYLLRAAETGVIGIMLYYTMTAMICLRLIRALRSPDPWIFGVSTGLLAAMLGSVAHRFFSYYHYVNLFMLLCVVIALTQFITEFEKKRLAAQSDEPDSPERILSMPPDR
jgi:hypothetical protein